VLAMAVEPPPIPGFVVPVPSPAGGLGRDSRSVRWSPPTANMTRWWSHSSNAASFRPTANISISTIVNRTASTPFKAITSSFRGAG
jgi:hypothetical protein